MITLLICFIILLFDIKCLYSCVYSEKKKQKGSQKTNSSTYFHRICFRVGSRSPLNINQESNFLVPACEKL